MNQAHLWGKKDMVGGNWGGRSGKSTISLSFCQFSGILRVHCRSLICGQGDEAFSSGLSEALFDARGNAGSSKYCLS